MIAVDLDARKIVILMLWAHQHSSAAALRNPPECRSFKFNASTESSRRIHSCYAFLLLADLQVCGESQMVKLMGVRLPKGRSGNGRVGVSGRRSAKHQMHHWLRLSRRSPSV